MSKPNVPLGYADLLEQRDQLLNASRMILSFIDAEASE